MQKTFVEYSAKCLFTFRGYAYIENFAMHQGNGKGEENADNSVLPLFLKLVEVRTLNVRLILSFEEAEKAVIGGGAYYLCYSGLKAYIKGKWQRARVFGDIITDLNADDNILLDGSARLYGYEISIILFRILTNTIKKLIRGGKNGKQRKPN